MEKKQRNPRRTKNDFSLCSTAKSAKTCEVNLQTGGKNQAWLEIVHDHPHLVYVQTPFLRVIRTFFAGSSQRHQETAGEGTQV